MLKVDLGRLERQRRLRIDEQVPADDPLWQNTNLQLVGPLDVALEAQQAGADVVVRGNISGRVAGNCRRCLREVQVDLREELSLVFRRGISSYEAEAEEVYVLPSHEHELDLGPAVREQVHLAVPQFVNCT